MKGQTTVIRVATAAADNDPTPRERPGTFAGLEAFDARRLDGVLAWLRESNAGVDVWVLAAHERVEVRCRCVVRRVNGGLIARFVSVNVFQPPTGWCWDKRMEAKVERRALEQLKNRF